MRALKVILILVLGILVMLLILGTTGSDSYRVERSTVVEAPVPSVWQQVSTFAAIDKWSPWNAMDPGMKKWVEGTDGTVGATWKWEGNKDVGKGEQRIDSLVPEKLVRTQLRFIEPFESVSHATVALAPEGEGTRVTWSMEGESGFWTKLMSKFMDMDAMIGKDFEKGLALLKHQAEEAYAKEPRFEVKEGEWGGGLYAGKRAVIRWADLQDAFSNGYAEVYAALAKAKLAPSGPSSAVYYAWNSADSTADVVVAVPVAPAAKGKLKELPIHELPASKACTIELVGGYSRLGAAHEAMDAHLARSGMEQHEAVVEEYVVGPAQEPDSARWLTRLIYLVRPKAD